MELLFALSRFLASFFIFDCLADFLIVSWVGTVRNCYHSVDSCKGAEGGGLTVRYQRRFSEGSATKDVSGREPQISE